MVAESVPAIQDKWRTLLLLALAETLGMAVWFSATAVVPALTTIWQLDDGGRAWLTMSVQIGFVVGAFGSAVFNLADRIPARRLFAASAALAGLATILIPLLANGLGSAILLRLLTGVFLAGLYPVGMKIMATWTRKDRGMGIGLLVGALTLGSALPHLINVFGGVGGEWKPVLYLAGISALLAAVIGVLFIDEGPYRQKAPPFNWKYVAQIMRERPVMLANIGYLGHMWELYAMWAWIPIFLLASFNEAGVSSRWAGLVSFAVIALGGIGSLVAGKLADQNGRTRITTISLLVSGASAISIGFLFGLSPWLVTLVALVWGFSVVADSAQFSAAVSELADSEYVGTALTLQTSMGFLLTLFTIRLIPPLQETFGWRYAFLILALGPIVGIWAMQTLRRSPAARRIAGGRG